MVDQRTLNCLRESEVDTIEISLRNRMEELISAGDLSTAELVEETISSLDKINLCDESSEWVRGLARTGKVLGTFER